MFRIWYVDGGERFATPEHVFSGDCDSAVLALVNRFGALSVMHAISELVNASTHNDVGVRFPVNALLPLPGESWLIILEVPD